MLSGFELYPRWVPLHFVKCRRTRLELNSYGPYPSSKREIKFRRCLFLSSIKREIRHFNVVVVQKRAKKCTKKRHARAKLLLCLSKPIVFFYVLVAVRVRVQWILKVPNIVNERGQVSVDTRGLTHR